MRSPIRMVACVCTDDLPGHLRWMQRLPGQDRCDLTNARVSTRVIVSSITAPPGGGGTRKFEVAAAGFHANAVANLSILDFPKSTDRITAQLTMNGAGSATWWRSRCPRLVTGMSRF